MRNVLGHISRNKEEIIGLLEKGGYTMCTLPHYRYEREKMVCGELMQYGMIRRTGRTETSVNYVGTDFFKQWRNDERKLNAKQYWRLFNPPKEFTRKCRQCENEFVTGNHHQKLCSKVCKSAENLAKRTTPAQEK